MPYMERSGDVFVLYLGTEGERDEENAFNPRWLDEAEALLDEVEASQGPAALVTTGVGKFYSTGLDTVWVAQNLGQLNSYMDRVHALFARVLTFPMATVAAMPGHTFGGGAILATAHDHQVMRGDRGFFCLPGITVGISYTPGVLELLTARLPARAVHAALTSGRRYGGTDALAHGLVDELAAGDDVLAKAVGRAQGLVHTRGRTLGEIKGSLYAGAVAALRTPSASLETQEAAVTAQG
ncbi:MULTISPECIES: enoyl-CoA hydratase/isomerase family protein [Rhodococcus]|jgi:Delta3-Delta2-enoyl-CoA isomerase|uniref:enoyl-CoA hydratase/isomerase family protein n=1 Tax=Rhodococcus TaxID=1827 RepID=UPI000BE40169|nr:MULTISPECIES: enoyl-CoA hydratase/isomerase family protein [Rhodococcus]MCZ4555087.1 enoyl-CoA hydratase/isomerase family protein [Rhodococcus maanshanensis]